MYVRAHAGSKFRVEHGNKAAGASSRNGPERKWTAQSRHCTNKGCCAMADCYKLGRGAMLTNKIPSCMFLRDQKGKTSLKKGEIETAMGNGRDSLTVATAPSQHLMNGCACSKYTYRMSN
ncbi:unnamed protein product [Acanthocheilonema viteae]|uniref:Uncharacterized protein n=1 Tax=Acanthocheilonema viteae TaxID=6277 RepID=A0A498SAN1_ACAVI|nr:unnamed protein product [Acanthocheilonema viteae]